MRSLRNTASSIEWVTKKTVAWVCRQRSSKQVLHVHARHRVERAEGLVHQDDPGPQDERLGDGHPLPHAAGELVRILVLIVRDAQADVADPRLAPAPGESCGARPGTPDRRRRCPARCGGRSWCSPGRPCPGPARDRSHRPAEDEHLAAGRRVLGPQPGDQPQDGALAAAAGPQDADEFSLVDEVLEPRSVTSRMAVNSFGLPGL